MEQTGTIENLIPHRSPFLFVDEIVSATKEEITGVKTFNEGNSWLRGSFPEFNFVPGTILIESMAQCGGAGIKMLNSNEGLFGLATIENAQFFKGVEYNKPVKFVIKNIRLSDRTIKQSGIAYVDDQPALEATWVCLKISN